MKKHVIVTLVVTIIAIICAVSLTACDTEPTQNEAKYWFSEYSKEFIAYDEAKDNLDEAGTYWKMTVKNDCEVSIAFTNQTYSMNTITVCTINNQLVQYDNDGILEYNLNNISLKKGDKIVLHAVSYNRLAVFTEASEMAMFTITNSEGNFPINDIK